MLAVPQVLRDAGLKVVEVDGWKERGRPGHFGPVRGVMVHHTGRGGSKALLDLITKGRDDLPGPLSQLFLDDDGTFYVVAAGKCNHAGPGQWQGTTLGNSGFIGIEARNAGDGKDIWEQEQLDALTVGTRALLKHFGLDPVMAVGHKEWAKPRGRKVDPSFDMFEFREGLEAIEERRVAAPPRTVNPIRDMLKKGDTGDSVRELQRRLKVASDGSFGPKTEAAVKAFQKANSLVVDGKVGPKTWAALGVTNS
jgi:N-acetyl-anhydromuramyl-L-alanine amidase AmpD